LKTVAAHGKGLIAQAGGRRVAHRRRTAARPRTLGAGADLPALEAGDYYWHQLQGLQVWCKHDGDTLLLGEVDHLLETGANDVLVLRPCEGSIDERERLIPYLPEDGGAGRWIGRRADDGVLASGGLMRIALVTVFPEMLGAVTTLV
jgi:ribosomal 30S subunit maturation factor RimM